MIDLDENNIRGVTVEILGDELNDIYFLVCNVFVSDSDCFSFPISKVFNSKTAVYSLYKKLGFNESFRDAFTSVNGDCLITGQYDYLGSEFLN